MRFHFVLIGIVVLCGCAGPAVRTATPPAVQPPAEWRSEVVASAPLDANWWLLFHDDELVRLVDLALAHNPDIGIAAARIRDARAQLLAAKGQQMPSLDLNAGGAYSRSVNAFGKPSEQEAFQPQVLASYELDLFGRLADQSAAAQAGIAASEAAQAATRLAIASAVASAYINLLSLDARLDIARQTLASRSESVRLARSDVDAGYAPQLALRQAEAEYEATAQIVPQLELLIAKQEDALSQLAGETPHAITRQSRLIALTEPAIPEGLPSELLRRRPDIVQAEYQLAATDAALAAARKRFLPQLKLTGAAGVALSTLLANPIAIWSLGGSVLAPLFEGGRIEAQVEGAAAQREVAAFGYQRVTLNAFREVEDNLAAIARLSEQIEHVRAQRDALASQLRLATNRYRAGYSSYLEQLDAQRGLLNAELSLVQIRADSLNAEIALYQALGGGWSGTTIAERREP